MKITMRCMKVEQDEMSYIYHFGVKKVSEDFNVQRFAGDFHIRSVDPMHYKPGRDYTLILSELISLETAMPGRN